MELLPHGRKDEKWKDVSHKFCVKVNKIYFYLPF